MNANGGKPRRSAKNAEREAVGNFLCVPCVLLRLILLSVSGFRFGDCFAMLGEMEIADEAKILRP